MSKKIGGTLKLSENHSISVGAIVAVVLIVIAIALFSSVQKNKECETRATQAAIDNYPINEYPDTLERGRLQSDYKQSYMATGCR